MTQLSEIFADNFFLSIYKSIQLIIEWQMLSIIIIIGGDFWAQDISASSALILTTKSNVLNLFNIFFLLIMFKVHLLSKTMDLFCISQRRTGSSPLWPPMGRGIYLGVGPPVPLVWWALSPSRSRKKRRRRPWGGSSSTSSWALVTSIMLRAASLSNWACSCSKSS